MKIRQKQQAITFDDTMRMYLFFKAKVLHKYYMSC